jgi:hypothetical protein
MDDFDYIETHRQVMKQLNAKHERMLRKNRIWLYIGIFLIAVWFIGTIVLKIVSS